MRDVEICIKIRYQSKINFKNDFESKSVYDRLNHELDANPDENYSIIETAISDSMNAHLEKKIVKFNRRKHKKTPGSHMVY